MIEIPVIKDASGLVRPAFSVTVNLLGASFVLSFHWNARASTWFFDLGSADGTPLVSGLAVRSGALLYPFVLSGFPLGLFFAWDTSDTAVDPGRADLGARVRIMFMEPDDL